MVEITHLATGSIIQYQGVDLIIHKTLDDGYRLMGKEDGKYKTCAFYSDEPISIEFLKCVISRQLIL